MFVFSSFIKSHYLTDLCTMGEFQGMGWGGGGGRGGGGRGPGTM